MNNAHIKPNCRLTGDQIRIGDFVRFRMSKYDPIRFLEVTCQPTLSAYGKRYDIGGVNWADTVSMKETRQVYRPEKIIPEEAA